jgi:hypothetical protein
MGVCYVLTCDDCGEPVTVPTAPTHTGQVAPNGTQPENAQVTTPPTDMQAVMQAGRRRLVNNNNNSRNKNNKKKKPYEDRLHYVGTSAKSLHARMLGHSRDIKGKQMSNAMAKHNDRMHKDMTVPPKYTISLLSTHLANLPRQVTEGKYLEIQNPEMSLNDCLEWSRSRGIVRIYTNTV